MDCLFCKIAAGEVQAFKVYEDESNFAFLDIMPRAPGHALVVPKAHAPTLLELSDEYLAKLSLAVKKVTALLQERLSPEGFTIGINHGEVSGQEVAHIHVHILPRMKGDGGHSIQSVVSQTPNPATDGIETIYHKIIQ